MGHDSGMTKSTTDKIVSQQSCIISEQSCALPAWNFQCSATGHYVNNVTQDVFGT